MNDKWLDFAIRISKHRLHSLVSTEAAGVEKAHEEK